MAMYLGDKPVKAIARSKNNLLDAPSVLKFKGYTTQYYFPVDLNGKYSFSFFVKADKVTSNASFVRLTVDGAPRHVAIWDSINKRVSYTVTGHITAIDFINWCNADCVVTEIMLNEGSTALPYEPYNQLFTVPIKKCVGKNLFDISNFTMKYPEQTAELSADKTSVTFYTNGQQNTFVIYHLKVEIGNKYTFSVEDIVGSIANGVAGNAGIFVCNSPLQDTSRYGYCKVGKPAKFTATSRDLYIKFYVTYLAGDYYATLVKPQLNEGDTALPYEPYREWYEY